MSDEQVVATPETKTNPSHFETTILSLDRSKFHLICLKTNATREDAELYSMIEEFQQILKSWDVQAMILPFVEGHQIDIKSMTVEEVETLRQQLLKTKETV